MAKSPFLEAKLKITVWAGYFSMAIKKIKPKNMDWGFLVVIFMLLIFGLFILSSASYIVADKKFGDPNFYLKAQLMKGVLIGLAGFLFFSKVPLLILKKYSFLFLIFSVGLMILIFIPRFGITYGGSTRWLNIGPLVFQPSEILKLSFIIYLASWLESRQKQLRAFSNGLLPFLAIMGIIGLLLVMQPNIGTFGIIAFSAAAVYFAAGAKKTHLFLLILIGIAAFSALIYLKPYAAERFLVFLNPQNDTSGAAYQINQSLTAIGVGGPMGIGMNQSLVSAYLPESIGDSIFAVLAEKLGLLGVSFTLILYLFFGVFGYRIAFKSQNYFPKFLAIGITSWILVQTFINIAATSGLMPLTGVPLPFISYGSSGLVINLIGAGIIANISRYND